MLVSRRNRNIVAQQKNEHCIYGMWHYLPLDKANDSKSSGMFPEGVLKEYMNYLINAVPRSTANSKNAFILIDVGSVYNPTAPLKISILNGVNNLWYPTKLASYILHMI